MVNLNPPNGKNFVRSVSSQNIKTASFAPNAVATRQAGAMSVSQDYFKDKSSRSRFVIRAEDTYGNIEYASDYASGSVKYSKLTVKITPSKFEAWPAFDFDSGTQAVNAFEGATGFATGFDVEIEITDKLSSIVMVYAFFVKSADVQTFDIDTFLTNNTSATANSFKGDLRGTDHTDTSSPVYIFEKLDPSTTTIETDDLYTIPQSGTAHRLNQYIQSDGVANSFEGGHEYQLMVYVQDYGKSLAKSGGYGYQNGFQLAARSETVQTEYTLHNQAVDIAIDPSRHFVHGIFQGLISEEHRSTIDPTKFVINDSKNLTFIFKSSTSTGLTKTILSDAKFIDSVNSTVKHTITKSNYDVINGDTVSFTGVTTNHFNDNTFEGEIEAELHIETANGRQGNILSSNIMIIDNALPTHIDFTNFSNIQSPLNPNQFQFEFDFKHNTNAPHEATFTLHDSSGATSISNIISPLANNDHGSITFENTTQFKEYDIKCKIIDDNNPTASELTTAIHTYRTIDFTNPVVEIDSILTDTSKEKTIEIQGNVFDAHSGIKEIQFVLLEHTDTDIDLLNGDRDVNRNKIINKSMITVSDGSGRSNVEFDIVFELYTKGSDLLRIDPRKQYNLFILTHDNETRRLNFDIGNVILPQQLITPPTIASTTELVLNDTTNVYELSKGDIRDESNFSYYAAIFEDNDSIAKESNSNIELFILNNKNDSNIIFESNVDGFISFTSSNPKSVKNAFHELDIAQTFMFEVSRDYLYFVLAVDEWDATSNLFTATNTNRVTEITNEDGDTMMDGDIFTITFTTSKSITNIDSLSFQLVIGETNTVLTRSSSISNEGEYVVLNTSNDSIIADTSESGIVATDPPENTNFKYKIRMKTEAEYESISYADPDVKVNRSTDQLLNRIFIGANEYDATTGGTNGSQTVVYDTDPPSNLTYKTKLNNTTLSKKIRILDISYDDDTKTNNQSKATFRLSNIDYGGHYSNIENISETSKDLIENQSILFENLNEYEFYLLEAQIEDPFGRKTPYQSRVIRTLDETPPTISITSMTAIENESNIQFSIDIEDIHSGVGNVLYYLSESSVSESSVLDELNTNSIGWIKIKDDSSNINNFTDIIETHQYFDNGEFKDIVPNETYRAWVHATDQETIERGLIYLNTHIEYIEITITGQQPQFIPSATDVKFIQHPTTGISFQLEGSIYDESNVEIFAAVFQDGIVDRSNIESIVTFMETNKDDGNILHQSNIEAFHGFDIANIDKSHTEFAFMDLKDASKKQPFNVDSTFGFVIHIKDVHGNVNTTSGQSIDINTVRHIRFTTDYHVKKDTIFRIEIIPDKEEQYLYGVDFDMFINNQQITQFTKERHTILSDKVEFDISIQDKNIDHQGNIEIQAKLLQTPFIANVSEFFYDHVPPAITDLQVQENVSSSGILDVQFKLFDHTDIPSDVFILIDPPDISPILFGTDMIRGDTIHAQLVTGLEEFKLYTVSANVTDLTDQANVTVHIPIRTVDFTAPTIHIENKTAIGGEANVQFILTVEDLGSNICNICYLVAEDANIHRMDPEFMYKHARDQRIEIKQHLFTEFITAHEYLSGNDEYESIRPDIDFRIVAFAVDHEFRSIHGRNSNVSSSDSFRLVGTVPAIAGARGALAELSQTCRFKQKTPENTFEVTGEIFDESNVSFYGAVVVKDKFINMSDADMVRFLKIHRDNGNIIYQANIDVSDSPDISTKLTINELERALLSNVDPNKNEVFSSSSAYEFFIYIEDEFGRESNTGFVALSTQAVTPGSLQYLGPELLDRLQVFNLKFNTTSPVDNVEDFTFKIERDNTLPTITQQIITEDKYTVSIVGNADTESFEEGKEGNTEFFVTSRLTTHDTQGTLTFSVKYKETDFVKHTDDLFGTIIVPLYDTQPPFQVELSATPNVSSHFIDANVFFNDHTDIKCTVRYELFNSKTGLETQVEIQDDIIRQTESTHIFDGLQEFTEYTVFANVRDAFDRPGDNDSVVANILTLDNSPPVVTIDIGPTILAGESNIQFFITAQDTLSGLGNVRYLVHNSQSEITDRDIIITHGKQADMSVMSGNANGVFEALFTETKFKKPADDFKESNIDRSTTYFVTVMATDLEFRKVPHPNDNIISSAEITLSGTDPLFVHTGTTVSCRFVQADTGDKLLITGNIFDESELELYAAVFTDNVEFNQNESDIIDFLKSNKDHGNVIYQSNIDARNTYELHDLDTTETHFAFDQLSADRSLLDDFRAQKNHYFFFIYLEDKFGLSSNITGQVETNAVILNTASDFVPVKSPMNGVDRLSDFKFTFNTFRAVTDNTLFDISFDILKDTGEFISLDNSKFGIKEITQSNEDTLHTVTANINTDDINEQGLIHVNVLYTKSHTVFDLEKHQSHTVFYDTRAPSILNITANEDYGDYLINANVTFTDHTEIPSQVVMSIQKDSDNTFKHTVEFNDVIKNENTQVQFTNNMEEFELYNVIANVTDPFGRVDTLVYGNIRTIDNNTPTIDLQILNNSGMESNITFNLRVSDTKSRLQTVRYLVHSNINHNIEELANIIENHGNLAYSDTRHLDIHTRSATDGLAVFEHQFRETHFINDDDLANISRDLIIPHPEGGFKYAVHVFAQDRETRRVNSNIHGKITEDIVGSDPMQGPIDLLDAVGEEVGAIRFEQHEAGDGFIIKGSMVDDSELELFAAVFRSANINTETEEGNVVSFMLKHRSLSDVLHQSNIDARSPFDLQFRLESNVTQNAFNDFDDPTDVSNFQTISEDELNAKVEPFMFAVYLEDIYGRSTYFAGNIDLNTVTAISNVDGGMVLSNGFQLFTSRSRDPFDAFHTIQIKFTMKKPDSADFQLSMDSLTINVSEPGPGGATLLSAIDTNNSYLRNIIDNEYLLEANLENNAVSIVEQMQVQLGYKTLAKSTYMNLENGNKYVDAHYDIQGPHITSIETHTMDPKRPDANLSTANIAFDDDTQVLNKLEILSMEIHDGTPPATIVNDTYVDVRRGLYDFDFTGIFERRPYEVTAQVTDPFGYSNISVANIEFADITPPLIRSFVASKDSDVEVKFDSADVYETGSKFITKFAVFDTEFVNTHANADFNTFFIQSRSIDNKLNTTDETNRNDVVSSTTVSMNSPFNIQHYHDSFSQNFTKKMIGNRTYTAVLHVTETDNPNGNLFSIEYLEITTSTESDTRSPLVTNGANIMVTPLEDKFVISTSLIDNSGLVDWKIAVFEQPQDVTSTSFLYFMEALESDFGYNTANVNNMFTNNSYTSIRSHITRFANIETVEHVFIVTKDGSSLVFSNVTSSELHLAKGTTYIFESPDDDTVVVKEVLGTILSSTTIEYFIDGLPANVDAYTSDTGNNRTLNFTPDASLDGLLLTIDTVEGVTPTFIDLMDANLNTYGLDGLKANVEYYFYMYAKDRSLVQNTTLVELPKDPKRVILQPEYPQFIDYSGIEFLNSNADGPSMILDETYEAVSIEGYYPLFTTEHFAYAYSANVIGSSSDGLRTLTFQYLSGVSYVSKQFYMPDLQSADSTEQTRDYFTGTYFPTAVNGYYPLYAREEDAKADSPSGGSHEHTFNGFTYHMPNGVTMYHGNYHISGPDEARGF